MENQRATQHASFRQQLQRGGRRFVGSQCGVDHFKYSKPNVDQLRFVHNGLHRHLNATSSLRNGILGLVQLAILPCHSQRNLSSMRWLSLLVLKILIKICYKQVHDQCAHHYGWQQNIVIDFCLLCRFKWIAESQKCLAKPWCEPILPFYTQEVRNTRSWELESIMTCLLHQQWGQIFMKSQKVDFRSEYHLNAGAA